jgi:hypothetical protein
MIQRITFNGKHCRTDLDVSFMDLKVSWLGPFRRLAAETGSSQQNVATAAPAGCFPQMELIDFCEPQ